MRSAVAFAAFAVSALAVPYGHRHHKRVLVTDLDIVTKTDIVYVTAGAAAPTSVALPASSVAQATAAAEAHHDPHALSEHQKWSGHRVQSSPAAPSSVVSSSVAPSPVAPSPSVVIVTTVLTPEEPSSTYVPPPAPTSVSSTSVEVKPEIESSPAPAPAPASPAPAAPAPASSAPEAAPTSYQDIVVYHHNIHRRNHSAPDMTWSDNLALSASIIASSCDYNHNTNVMGGGYGQNIAAGVDSANISSVITDLFYNGEEPNFSGLYGQAQPSMDTFDSWGHFSQLVWKASTQVGCATQYCPNGLANTGGDVDPYFTVCNYDAVGNMANEYGDNIGSPLGMPTAQWNTGL